MKNRKLITTILTIAMSLCLVFGLAACGPKTPETPEHTHEYATTYSHDATNHWFACSCGEKKDLAAHVFTDGVCVCGYEESAPEPDDPTPDLPDAAGKYNKYFDAFVKSLTEIKEGEGIHIDIVADRVYAEEAYVYMPNVKTGEREDVPATLDLGASGEIFITVNEDKIPVLYYHFGVVGKYLIDDVVVVTESVSQNAVVEGDTAYVQMSISEFFPEFSEEDQEIYNSTQTQYQMTTITPEGDSEQMPEEVKAILLEKVLPEIESFFNDEFAPEIEEIYDEYKDTITDALAESIVAAHKIAETEDGYELAFDLDILKGLNEALSDKSVKEIYEDMNGEDSYELLKEEIIGIYDVTVDDLLMLVFTEEFTMEELEEEINKIIALVYADAEEVPTIEDLYGADIFEMLADEEFTSQTIAELIAANDEEFDLAAAKEGTLETLDYIGGNPIYGLLVTENDVKDLNVAVNAAIALIESAIDAKVIIAEDGSFESIAIEVEAEGKDIIAINNLQMMFEAVRNDEDNSDTVYEFPEEIPTMEIGAHVVITIGEFANHDDIDFDEIMQNARFEHITEYK